MADKVLVEMAPYRDQAEQPPNAGTDQHRGLRRTTEDIGVAERN
jgi:hypothetical protein